LDYQSQLEKTKDDEFTKWYINYTGQAKKARKEKN